MPNRVIKDSIKHSQQIDSLTWFEEVLFYRLIITADDYGCIDGRVVLLKNELFPLKENVTKKAVEDAIDKLASIGLLCKYTVNGMPYLFFPTWEKHQRLRNQHRKYPAPPENYLTDDCLSNDGQMTDECQQFAARAGAESESEIESEKEKETQHAPARETAFDEFWTAYPKKKNKEDARKAFAKVKAPLETLLSAIELQKQSKDWKKENGQYIPYPATWLRAGAWENEDVQSEKPKSFADMWREAIDEEV